MSAVTTRIAAHAAATPDRPALVFEHDRILWGELALALDRIAAHIVVRVPAGQGVALHLPNGPALTLLFLAAAHAGREAQVLDPDWPPDMTNAVLAALAPAMVVTTDPRIVWPNATMLDNALMPFTEVVRIFGTPSPGVLPEPADNLPFYVGFTSGSTGSPKGYRRDHRSWLESFRGDAIEFGIDANDVVLAPGNADPLAVPLCHGPRPPCRCDGRAVPAFPSDAHPAARARATRQRPLWRADAVAAPSGSRWIGERSAFPNRALGSVVRLQMVWRCHAATAPAVSRIALRRVLRRLGAELRHRRQHDERVPEGSVGRAFPGVTVSVRDRLGRRLPTARTGFVFAEGPLLFQAMRSAPRRMYVARDERSRLATSVSWMPRDFFIWWGAPSA